MRSRSSATTSQTPWGVVDRLPQAAGARLFHPERAVLADGVPLRRAALRRRARDQRAGLPRRDGAHDPRRRSSPGRHVHLVLEHEGNKASPPRARPVRRAMDRRLASLHARPADRRARGLLRGLPGRRRPARPRAWRRGSSIRARCRRITASRAASRAGTCRRPPSSSACRTTTRSATAPSATG